MADYDSSLPVRTIGQESCVEVMAFDDTNGIKVALTTDNVSGGVKVAASDDTNGIKVALTTATLVGQKEMDESIPVVLASDQSIINVNIVSSTPLEPINIYDIAEAVDPGSGSKDTFTYPATGDFKLAQVTASASGAFKVEVWAGPDGTEACIAVAFGTSANPFVVIPFPNELSVAEDDNVLIIMTNRDKQAQDLYKTINGYNVPA